MSRRRSSTGLWFVRVVEVRLIGRLVWKMHPAPGHLQPVRADYAWRGHHVADGALAGAARQQFNTCARGN